MKHPVTPIYTSTPNQRYHSEKPVSSLDEIGRLCYIIISKSPGRIAPDDIVKRGTFDPPSQQWHKQLRWCESTVSTA